jgi:hypothetical protein
MIHIEDNRWRRLGVTCKKVVHQGTGEPIEVVAVDVVLETREGRGAGSVVGRIHGTPLHPEFEHGVMAEVMGVIRVRIS